MRGAHQKLSAFATTFANAYSKGKLLDELAVGLHVELVVQRREGEALRLEQGREEVEREEGLR